MSILFGEAILCKPKRNSGNLEVLVLLDTAAKGIIGFCKMLDAHDGSDLISISTTSFNTLSVFGRFSVAPGVDLEDVVGEDFSGLKYLQGTPEFSNDFPIHFPFRFSYPSGNIMTSIGLLTSGYSFGSSWNLESCRNA